MGGDTPFPPKNFMNHLMWPIMCMCACSVTKSCLTLYDHEDCSLLGSSAHRIFQARTLEWVAISSSREASWTRDQTHVSCRLLRWQTDSLPLSHLGRPRPNTHKYHSGHHEFKAEIGYTQGSMIRTKLSSGPLKPRGPSFNMHGAKFRNKTDY